MPPALGFESYVAIGAESAWGTPAARTQLVEIISESMKQDSAPIPKASLTGFDIQETHQGAKAVGGELATELYYETHEKLLRAAIGNGVTTLVVAGVYQHVFTPAKVLPSLSMEVYRDISTFLYEGVKLNTLALSLATDQVLRATYGAVAKDETPDVVATPLARPAEKLPVFHQGVFKIDTVAFDVAEFTFNHNNQLAVDRKRVGTRLIKEPVRNAIATSDGSFTADFESTAQYLKFLAATPVALQLQLIGEQIGVTGHFYTITLDIPRARYTGETPQVGGPAIVPENFPFMALRSADGVTPPFTLTVKNSLAAI
jgi:hypothetical protein